MGTSDLGFGGSGFGRTSPGGGLGEAPSFSAGLGTPSGLGGGGGSAAMPAFGAFGSASTIAGAALTSLGGTHLNTAVLPEGRGTSLSQTALDPSDPSHCS